MPFRHRFGYLVSDKDASLTVSSNSLDYITYLNSTLNYKLGVKRRAMIAKPLKVELSWMRQCSAANSIRPDTTQVLSNNTSPYEAFANAQLAHAKLCSTKIQKNDAALSRPLGRTGPELEQRQYDKMTRDLIWSHARAFADHIADHRDDYKLTVEDIVQRSWFETASIDDLYRLTELETLLLGRIQCSIMISHVGAMSRSYQASYLLLKGLGLTDISKESEVEDRLNPRQWLKESVEELGDWMTEKKNIDEQIEKIPDKPDDIDTLTAEMILGTYGLSLAEREGSPETELKKEGSEKKTKPEMEDADEPVESDSDSEVVEESGSRDTIAHEPDLDDWYEETGLEASDGWHKISRSRLRRPAKAATNKTTTNATTTASSSDGTIIPTLPLNYKKEDAREIGKELNLLSYLNFSQRLRARQQRKMGSNAAREKVSVLSENFGNVVLDDRARREVHLTKEQIEGVAMNKF